MAINGKKIGSKTAMNANINPPPGGNGNPTFATVTDAALRWQVDRATARAAIVAAKIEPSNFHATPRYAWHDLLTFVEGWDDLAVMSIDTTARLYRAEEIADRFNLTSQTIRNYGRSGRLHEIRLSIRTLRYAQKITPVQQSEANSVEHGKL
jgi:hypothetical protein